MTYEILPKCKKDIKKACKKNAELRKSIKRKIEEIIKNPYHYKPLKNKLKGIRRVHIMKCFVLSYTIEKETVKFLSFKHHDEAYKWN